MSSRFRQKSSVYITILYRMIMTVNKNVDTLYVFQHIVRTIAGHIGFAAQMTYGYNQVDTVFFQGIHFSLRRLIQVFLRKEGQSAYTQRVRCRNRRRCRQSEYADFNITAF